MAACLVPRSHTASDTSGHWTWGLPTRNHHRALRTHARTSLSLVYAIERRGPLTLAVARLPMLTNAPIGVGRPGDPMLGNVALRPDRLTLEHHALPAEARLREAAMHRSIDPGLMPNFARSVVHLDRIELRTDDLGYRSLLPRLLDHPRARVALEERGQLLPRMAFALSLSAVHWNDHPQAQAGSSGRWHKPARVLARLVEQRCRRGPNTSGDHQLVHRYNLARFPSGNGPGRSKSHCRFFRPSGVPW